MKVFVPFRSVEAPALSEEEISRLMEGRYVEGDFGLEEGDVFLLGDRGVMCYRTVDSGRCRIRRTGV